MHLRAWILCAVGLLITACLARPAFPHGRPETNALAAAVSYTSTTVGGPAWARASSDCGAVSPSAGHAFHVQRFTVSAIGAYDLTSAQVGFDGYLLVYSGNFDPASPLDNCLAGDDDDVDTRTSAVRGELTGHCDDDGSEDVWRDLRSR